MEDFSMKLDKKDYQMIMSCLEDLEKIDQRKAINKGLRTGIKKIIIPGKANLASRHKVRKGNLRSSFSTRLGRKRKGNASIYAGFRRPKGAVAHLLDRGTAERWTKKGQYRGKVKPSYFWTDAAMEHSREAVQTLRNTILMEIDRIIQSHKSL